MFLPQRSANLYFNKEDAYSLRGIAMLMIVIHHIWMDIVLSDGEINEVLTSYVFIPWGYLGTGVFFLLSGYGMFFSLTSQRKLKFQYLKVRLWKLIKPFILCYIVTVCFICSFRHDLLTFNLIIDFITLTIPSTVTWFLKVIFITYIISYYVFCCNIKTPYKVYLILILTIFYVGIARLYLPQYWYSSILNFPVGMILALLNKYINDKGYLYLLASFSITTMCVTCLGISVTLPMSLLFSLTLVVISRWINIQNHILRFIGKESLSFYLFQMPFLFIGVSTGIVHNWVLFGIMVLSLTYLSAIFYKKINNSSK